ncbi:MAG TPA: fluoride efflux transporter CrcB [Saprospiraceae bacterium]|nr:fluoride efflux transporter CrcB [Saprospiraceae bacterium]
MQFLYVFIGGGIGSVFRYSLSKWIPFYHGHFPFATLIANILASLILGLLLGFSFKYNINDEYKWLLMAGFCGGFSTFSTFSAECITLLERQQPAMMVLYIVISVLTGIFAVFAGLKITGFF